MVAALVIALTAVTAVTSPASDLQETTTASAPVMRTARVTLSGKPQTLFVYPTSKPASAVVILASGDLGWMGFVVNVAEYLQSQNVAVLGVNSRAYLSSFTSAKGALDPAQIPGDYEVLVHEARSLLNTADRPVLAGISEGAGLSIIAAADVRVQAMAKGVITLGLPESIELGWRAWKDWTIWITKSEPNEPHVVMTPYMRRVAPLPLVMIQSTHDEFVAIDEAHRLFEAAQEPKRVFEIPAKNHRFSDQQPAVHARLNDALSWIRSRE